MSDNVIIHDSPDPVATTTTTTATTTADLGTANLLKDETERIFFHPESATFYSTLTMMLRDIPTPNVEVDRTKWALLLSKYAENPVDMAFSADNSGQPILVERSSLLPLASLKERKRREINGLRDDPETLKFKYNGLYYDSGVEPSLKINTTATLVNSKMIQQGKEIASQIKITWTTYDNTDVELNGTQVIELLEAMVSHVSEVHVRGRVIKALIESALTRQEVNQITWDMDISPHMHLITAQAANTHTETGAVSP